MKKKKKEDEEEERRRRRKNTRLTLTQSVIPNSNYVIMAID
jgi:hypothetical protein